MSWSKVITLLKASLHFSQKEIKRLTFKQVEIYLFEINQNKIEETLERFMQEGGKIEDLETDNPLYKKWLEITGADAGIELTEDVKTETSNELDFFIDKLQKTASPVEELKRIFENAPDIKDT